MLLHTYDEKLVRQGNMQQQIPAAMLANYISEKLNSTIFTTTVPTGTI